MGLPLARHALTALRQASKWCSLTLIQPPPSHGPRPENSQCGPPYGDVRPGAGFPAAPSAPVEAAHGLRQVRGAVGRRSQRPCPALLTLIWASAKEPAEACSGSQMGRGRPPRGTGLQLGMCLSNYDGSTTCAARSYHLRALP